MTEHDAAVLDSTIHYEETGEGRPIVFLHGNPTSSYLWRNVIPRVEAKGRCLAPDLIGMGKSGRPNLPYRFEDHARYLDAWFDALALKDVVLVIHDWGSTLGIHWAKRHPERVAGIAMMEAILRSIPWSEFPEGIADVFRGFRTPEVGEKMVLEDNVFIEQILPGAVQRALSTEEMDAYRAPFPTPQSRRPVLVWPRELPLGGEPADVVAVIEENERWLAESSVPKLLLTFEPGLLITAPVVKWCEDRFRNLETVPIGPGLHYVQEDHPESIGDAVKDWITRAVA